MRETGWPRTVIVEQVVPGTPEQVWRAWTSPTEKPWWWGTSDDAELVICEMDVDVGGQYRYGMRPRGAIGEPSEVAYGEYLDVRRPHSLQYTWSWGHDPSVRDTLVSVSFESAGLATTRVRVVHERQPHAVAAAVHEQGWRAKLTDLAGWLAGDASARQPTSS